MRSLFCLHSDKLAKIFIKSVCDMPQGCQDVTGRDSEEATQEASVKADVLKRYEDKSNSLIKYIKSKMSDLISRNILTAN